MKTPLVSVCLPNLNTFPFLQERVDTIFGQTYENWELIVTDSYSNDGAWEFFQRLAEKDRRVSIAQAPRGLYPGWNNCLMRSRGDYVYIATSDDTMAPNLLEKMVAGLETYTDCDLAHCPLVIIDESGSRLSEYNWPNYTVFGHGLGPMIHLPHIRRAPYDGLLHLTGNHVVLSITQLVVRRSLFSKTGYFSSRWGSIGDFNWEMKAGLVANMIHVPDTWASWRRYATQATNANNVVQMKMQGRLSREFEEMIQDAVEVCKPFLPPKVVGDLKSCWLGNSRELRQYYIDLYNRPKLAARRIYQLTQLLWGTKPVRSQILSRALGESKWPDAAPMEIRAWLEKITGRSVIEPLPCTNSTCSK